MTVFPFLILALPWPFPAQSLEREIRDFSQERGKRLKSAQDKLKKAKTDLEAAKKVLKQKDQKLQEAVAEAESAEREVDELDKKIQAATKSLKGERTPEVLAMAPHIPVSPHTFWDTYFLSGLGFISHC